jgi:hypothetical protein
MVCTPTKLIFLDPYRFLRMLQTAVGRDPRQSHYSKSESSRKLEAGSNDYLPRVRFGNINGSLIF